MDYLSVTPSGPQKQIFYNTWISLNMRIEITNRADSDIQFSTRPNVNFRVSSIVVLNQITDTSLQVCDICPKRLGMVQFWNNFLCQIQVISHIFCPFWSRAIGRWNCSIDTTFGTTFFFLVTYLNGLLILPYIRAILDTLFWSAIWDSIG